MKEKIERCEDINVKSHKLEAERIVLVTDKSPIEKLNKGYEDNIYGKF